MKMQRQIILFLLLALIFGCALSAGAQQYVDPILVDRPDPTVYQCSEDLFLELPGQGKIANSLSGYIAKESFVYFLAEFLYLQDEPWNGIDKGSFVLKQVSADGTETRYPLNFVMTMRTGMNNGWKVLTDQQTFATLTNLMLVFDVPYNVMSKGWSLLFSPAERGGEPVCEIEIPLKVSY